MSEAQTAVKLTAIQKLNNKLATLFERITNDTATYNDLLAQVTDLERLANIKEGDTVVFSFGKGETAGTQEALVLGVSDGVAKVTYGSGFDTTVQTIKLTQVVSVAADEVVETAEAPADVPASTDEQVVVG